MSQAARTTIVSVCGFKAHVWPVCEGSNTMLRRKIPIPKDKSLQYTVCAEDERCPRNRPAISRLSLDFRTPPILRQYISNRRKLRSLVGDATSPPSRGRTDSPLMCGVPSRQELCLSRSAPFHMPRALEQPCAPYARCSCIPSKSFCPLSGL